MSEHPQPRKVGAWTMLPPAPDVCQECAYEHPPDLPHNRDSLYYGMHFRAEHGRAPTWSDAMAHCSPGVQALWKEQIVEAFTRHNIPVPPDLLDGAPPPA